MKRRKDDKGSFEVLQARQYKIYYIAAVSFEVVTYTDEFKVLTIEYQSMD